MIVPAFIRRLMADKKVGGLKLGPEDRICIDFATRLRVAALEGRLRAIWCHVANEVGGGRGRSSAIAYRVAKALGLIPGAADYFFMWEGGGGVIEFKSETGRQTENQKDFQAWCEYLNVDYRIARSADEGEAILKEWGVLR